MKYQAIKTKDGWKVRTPSGSYANDTVFSDKQAAKNYADRLERLFGDLRNADT